MSRPITDPYAVIEKATGKLVVIQRDGYYPPEVLQQLERPSVAQELALQNSGFYEKLRREGE